MLHDDAVVEHKTLFLMIRIKNKVQLIHNTTFAHYLLTGYFIFQFPCKISSFLRRALKLEQFFHNFRLLLLLLLLW